VEVSLSKKIIIKNKKITCFSLPQTLHFKRQKRDVNASLPSPKACVLMLEMTSAVEPYMFEAYLNEPTPTIASKGKIKYYKR